METGGRTVVGFWVLVGGIALDWVCKEPPVRLHPVVWCGAWFRFWGKRLSSHPLKGWSGGALAWSAGAVIVGTTAWWVQSAWQGRFWPLGALVGLWMVWGGFAYRMLLEEVASVETALAGSVEAGRERLSWLVSRPVADLEPHEVRMAALSTLAENLSDSVVSPLFWFAVAGLPGLVLQRYANTGDALWGYRGAWEWKGKWAARCDDVLNWIPARLTGWLLVWGGPRWRQLPAQARRTESPNAGWPMAGLALALGVRLEKRGAYSLGDGPAPEAPCFEQGWRRVRRVGGWVMAGAVLLEGLKWSL